MFPVNISGELSIFTLNLEVFVDVHIGLDVNWISQMLFILLSKFYVYKIAEKLGCAPIEVFIKKCMQISTWAGSCTECRKN